MSESEHRYPFPTLRSADAVVNAVRANPPDDIFPKATKFIDLRYLQEANTHNTFGLNRMAILASHIEEKNPGFLEIFDSGMMSHLGYPYSYSRRTITKGGSSEEEPKMVTQHVTYTFSKTEGMPQGTNDIWRLAETLEIDGLMVGDDTVDVKIIQYQGQESDKRSLLNFYHITTQHEGKIESTITVGYPGI